MAGKRLLDAASLFSASRAVASKHLALRSRQLDVYKRTSSLAKAVKNQTDRVTLTLQAASALAQRFDGPGEAYSTQASSGKQTRAGSEGAPVPSHDSVEGTGLGKEKREGLEQDHFYDKSKGNATAEPVPDGGWSVRQEKAERYPLPDGTIPPAGSDLGVSKQDNDVLHKTQRTEPVKEPLTEGKQGAEAGLEPKTSGRTSIPEPASYSTRLGADDAKRLQRQAEFQIPSHPADPPPSISSRDGFADSRADQDKDHFYKPSLNASPVLSSLPRVKVPKVTEDTQGSDEHVQDAQLNQDVFYSASRNNDYTIPESQAIFEQNSPSEDMYSELFHSPKVARMLKGTGAKSGSSKGLNMRAAEDTPVDHSDLTQGKDQETFNVRNLKQKVPEKPEQPVSGSLSQTQSSDEEMHKLAADMASDVEKASSQTVHGSAAVEEPRLESAPYTMHESSVPSSRLGRLWQYGGLATSMALGAVGESLRRATGGSDNSSGSLMLSPGNMERLVAKLSRMRGAALKLGQMMSFQDSKMLPAPIHEVLQRVQDSADYMPASQRNKVLSSNLGDDWRDLFESFEEMPMAAASIGQVHGAVFKSTGQRVAVKVQYPGVANSIDSDLNNLSILLTASRLLPKGLYLDKTIANARTELAWECDYIREAECGRRFKELLKDEQDTFLVPSIIDKASGPQVLTMERMEGVGVTKVHNLTQTQKDWIGAQILRLCLREITEFKFMQTDPNWTNFLFNSKTQKLELLDFGASREYPAKFIDPYIRILLAASRDDREACRDLSIQLGYLTGHESQAMLKAHVSSVITLAEPFRESSPEVYDFRDQTITERVKGLIPVMIRGRLAPPPEETYSLHRKLSGAFLLCARLGSRVRCREMFTRAIEKAGVHLD